MSKKTKMPPKGTGRSDIFQTRDPHISVQPLLEHLHGDEKVWCPSSGEGRMLSYIQEAGHKVKGTDILTGFDFLDRLNPLPDFDVIIENPPYSIKDKYLARCFEIGKPFALLMPVTALGEMERVKMYKKHGIEILLLKKRTIFITPTGKEGGSWFYACWFCWKVLPQPICFE